MCERVVSPYTHKAYTVYTVYYILHTPHIQFHSTLLQCRRVECVQPQKLATPLALDSLHNYRSMVSVKILNINTERKKKEKQLQFP